MIGSFGDFIFEVSSEKIRTFENLNRKRSAVFAEHAVLDRKPHLQFTGLNCDEVSFSVKLSIALGLVVEKELKKLAEMLTSGRPHSLIIGDDVLGKFVLTGFDENWETVSNKGQILQASVTLSLKEAAV